MNDPVPENPATVTGSYIRTSPPTSDVVPRDVVIFVVVSPTPIALMRVVADVCALMSAQIELIVSPSFFGVMVTDLPDTDTTVFFPVGVSTRIVVLALPEAKQMPSVPFGVHTYRDVACHKL